MRHFSMETNIIGNGCKEAAPRITQDKRLTPIWTYWKSLLDHLSKRTMNTKAFFIYQPVSAKGGEIVSTIHSYHCFTLYQSLKNLAD